MIRSVDHSIELAQVRDEAIEAWAPYLERMEVGFCQGRFPKEVLAKASQLKWVHTSVAGVDNLDGTGMLDGPFTLTSSVGSHRLQMAEYIISMMLMHARSVPVFFQAQKDHKWLS